MKRIIIEYIPPSTEQAGIFSMPDKSIAIQYNGKLYIDYIVDKQTENPIEPFYIGEMLADGSVIDIVGDAGQFPHVFSGWDRKTPDAEIMAQATITPRQARLALLQEGMLDMVNSIVAQQPKYVQLTWEYSTEIQRNNPLLNNLLAYLGKTPDEIDSIFRIAAEM
jgi:hypothetical protein